MTLQFNLHHHLERSVEEVSGLKVVWVCSNTRGTGEAAVCLKPRATKTFQPLNSGIRPSGRTGAVGSGKGRHNQQTAANKQQTVEEASVQGTRCSKKRAGCRESLQSHRQGEFEGFDLHQCQPCSQI